MEMPGEHQIKCQHCGVINPAMTIWCVSCDRRCRDRVDPSKQSTLEGFK